MDPKLVEKSQKNWASFLDCWNFHPFQHIHTLRRGSFETWTNHTLKTFKLSGVTEREGCKWQSENFTFISRLVPFGYVSLEKRKKQRKNAKTGRKCCNFVILLLPPFMLACEKLKFMIRTRREKLWIFMHGRGGSNQTLTVEIWVDLQMLGQNPGHLQPSSLYLFRL